jgi:hypothetical protein
MPDLAPELKAVLEAIQNLINAIEDEPHLLDSAVVVWEAASFDGDEVQRCIRYTVPTDNNFSMSSALGLLIEAGKHYIRRDILGAE